MTSFLTVKPDAPIFLVTELGWSLWHVMHGDIISHLKLEGIPHIITSLSSAPMNRPLIRPFARSAFQHAPRFLPRRPPFLLPSLIQARTVASTVSNKPASQTLEHAAKNIKEEVGNSATDLAKVIAGANVKNVNIASRESFVSQEFTNL